MSNVDLLQMTISELAPKIQNKEVSPVELTEAALAEADRLQPTLNSFITILHDRAMDQARESESAISRGDYRGPLHGIPIGLKDNLATAGITTTVGSKVLANHVPEEDAEVVTRCRNAGAILIGKENLEGVRRRGDLQQSPLRGGPQPLGARPHSWRVQRRRRR